MTKRERLRHYMANEPLDRVPVAIFHHFCSPEEFYTGLENEAAFERNIAGHRISREIYDPDVAKIMNETLLLIPLDMTGVEPKDFGKVKIEPLNSRFFDKVLELTSRSRAAYDADTPVYCTGFSPALILRMCLVKGGVQGIATQTGEAKFLKYLVEEPAAVSDLLAALTERTCELHHLLMTECGCDGLYFSVNNQCRLIAEHLYKSYIAPYEKKVLAEANKDSDINMLHICGFAGKPNDLALFRDYAAAAFNWAVTVEGVPLSEGKKLFDGKPVCGGFGQTKNDVLYKGTREEVETAVFKLLEDAGQKGVMLGADCTVPTDIDDSRFEWVRQAAKKFAEQ